MGLICLAVFFLFSFCNQVVLVHLVNYATDLGFVPLVAATLLSMVGLSNIAGRIGMGAISDKIGNINILVVSCLVASLSLILLTFAGDLWMLYLFAVAYGFAHGAEVPQQTALVGKFFGIRVTLVGVIHGISLIGSAIGAWLTGQIFDITGSYRIAFLIGVGAIIIALTSTLVLGRQKPPPA